MTTLAKIAAIIVLTSSLCECQSPAIVPEKSSAEVPVRQLHPASSRKLQIPPFSMHGVAQSDRNGNIYVLADASGDIRESVVLKISERGESVIYKLPKEYSAVDIFGVSSLGRVSVLADVREPPRRALVTFSSIGEPGAGVTVDAPLEITPKSILLFENGDFVLRGLYGSSAEERLKGRPYWSFFNAMGRIERDLSEQDKGQSKSDVGVKLFEGAATIGDDQRVYFAVGDNIKTATEAGEIIDSYDIPNLSSGHTTAKLAKVGNRIAIWQYRTTEDGPLALRLALIDSVAKELISYFEPDEKLGTWCFVFTGKSFEFLVEEDGVLKLVTAEI